MRLPILLFAMLPVTASAQIFTFGVQGGVPVETPLGQTDKMPFTVGPTVNVHIFRGLSLDSGLLYDRIGRRSDNLVFFLPENGVTLGFIDSHASAIEVPLLAKYRFRAIRSGWRPFVTAGPTIRRTSIKSENLVSILSGTPLGSTGTGSAVAIRTSQWNIDPAAGVGMDIRAGRFHFEPEVRYSYWAAGKNSPIRKNQVNVLMGFRF
jgi:outer membrane protein with beta-barrel domain